MSSSASTRPSGLPRRFQQRPPPPKQQQPQQQSASGSLQLPGASHIPTSTPARVSSSAYASTSARPLAAPAPLPTPQQPPIHAWAPQQRGQQQQQPVYNEESESSEEGEGERLDGPQGSGGHVLVQQAAEHDSTFFEDMRGQAGAGWGDESLLMGVNYQPQAGGVSLADVSHLPPFAGFDETGVIQEDAASADTTLMLAKRAFGRSINDPSTVPRLPSVGLGERVLEMLMQGHAGQPPPAQPLQPITHMPSQATPRLSSASRRQSKGKASFLPDTPSQSHQVHVPASAHATPQAVLQRMELGNSQMNRSLRGSRLGESRDLLRKSIRKNERQSVGAGGQSFVEFETEVRFGDDLHVQQEGDGSSSSEEMQDRSTTPEAEPTRAPFALSYAAPPTQPQHAILPDTPRAAPAALTSAATPKSILKKTLARSALKPSLDVLGQIKQFDRSKLAKVAFADLVSRNSEVRDSEDRTSCTGQHGLDLQDSVTSQAQYADTAPLAVRRKSSRLSSAPAQEIVPSQECPPLSRRSVSGVAVTDDAAQLNDEDDARKEVIEQPLGVCQQSSAASVAAPTGACTQEELRRSVPAVPVTTDVPTRRSRQASRDKRRATLAAPPAPAPPPDTRRRSLPARAVSLVPSISAATVQSKPIGEADTRPLKAGRRRSSLAKSVLEETVAIVGKPADCSVDPYIADETPAEVTSEGPFPVSAHQAPNSPVRTAISAQKATTHFSPMRVDDNDLIAPASLYPSVASLAAQTDMCSEPDEDEDEDDPFTSIAASPQVDRSRRRGALRGSSAAKDRLAASTRSRHNLSHMVSLSPVVEERSGSTSVAMMSGRANRTMQDRNLASANASVSLKSAHSSAAEDAQLQMVERIREEEARDISLQKRLAELQRELQEVEALAQTSRRERSSSSASSESSIEQSATREPAFPIGGPLGSAGIDEPSTAQLQGTEPVAAVEQDDSSPRASVPVAHPPELIEEDVSSSDEDIQAPILQSLIHDLPTAIVQDNRMQSPERAAVPPSSTVAAPVAEVIRQKGSSVFDRLAAPSQPAERVLSRQGHSERARSMRPTLRAAIAKQAPKVLLKPYDRPASRTSVRSAEPPRPRNVPKPLPAPPMSIPSRPLPSVRATSASLRPAASEVLAGPAPAAPRPRTVSVPVNFSPRATKVRRIQREKQDDDMFSRKQRDRSRDCSSSSVSGISSRSASRASHVSIARTARSAIAPAVRASQAPLKPASHKPEKRKREEGAGPSAGPPGAAEHTVARSAAVSLPVARGAAVAARCLADAEAFEDEIVVPLTCEALAAQDKLNASLLLEEAVSAAAVKDLDKTAKTETIQRYLKELQEAEEQEGQTPDAEPVYVEHHEVHGAPTNGEQDIRSEQVENEAYDEAVPAAVPGDIEPGLPAAKRARVDEVAQPRLMPASAAPAVTTVKAWRPLGPSRAGNLARPTLSQQAKQVQPAKIAHIVPATVNKPIVTVTQPFSFRTSGRPQASFQERLASWQEREQEAAKEGRTSLRRIEQGDQARRRAAPKHARIPLETKEFNFVSDKRMEDRRDWEERLHEKERILGELAAIKRAEAEAKEAEEIRELRKRQVPKANPVPRHIYA